VRKHTQTNNVIDLPRSNRPRVTSDHDDRALQRLVRRMAQEVAEHAYDGLTCPKYAIWDSNPGSWLAKHHAKHDCRCWSANSGRLMTLLDLSPADFRRFLTVFVDRRSYHNITSDVQLEGWDEGLRPSSKHEGVTPGTELWTIAWCNLASNWQMFCTGGCWACIRRPNMSQICYMGFKSGLMAG
jgi:hypothetical protein